MSVWWRFVYVVGEEEVKGLGSVFFEGWVTNEGNTSLFVGGVGGGEGTGSRGAVVEVDEVDQLYRPRP